MKIDIIVPAAGESVVEGDIARWFKKNGDIVEMDEPLLELETEKASLEISAEGSGELTILAEEGQTVQVGQTIGYIDSDVGKKVEASAEKKETGTDDSGHEVVDNDDEGDSEDSVDDEVEALPSPAARKMMAEHDLSSQEIRGTGKAGRITKADVLKFIESRDKQDAIANSRKKFLNFYESNAPVTSPDETITLFRSPTGSKSKPIAAAEASDREQTTAAQKLAVTTAASGDAVPPATTLAVPNRIVRTEKLSRMRKTIARRLVDAQQTAALLTTFNEVDVSAIINIRKKYKEEFKEKHNVNLGFMSFFTKAVCQSLVEFPIINAQMDGESISFFDYCDIGIAVSTPKGLVVPVIRNAESLALHEVEQAIVDLATKGRDGKLTMEDLTGGTFTITNGGVFGSMLSTPIVNSPQSAILGMHNIVKRPVVVDDEIVIRSMMYLAVTYDHRLIDGSDAVKFLVKIKELCESPVKLMLEI